MSTPLEDGTLANGDVIETVHISQLFPIVEALEDNQANYREDIGVADAYKVDFSGSVQANEISAYQAGQQIVFKAAHSNTGPSTLQVAGPSGDLSAVGLKKSGSQDLEAGDIEAGQMVLAVYNDEGGGRFELVAGSGSSSSPEPAPPDGTEFYRQDGGSTNDYELDASGAGSNPAEISALVAGQIYTFKAANSNNGSATLEVTGPSGSLGAKDITRRGSPLVAGDILADTVVAVVYNDEGGGRFELLGESRPEDGTAFCRDGSGSADQYQVDASGSGSNPRPFANLENGAIFTFRAPAANTGASTLEIFGAPGSYWNKDITKRGEALEAGDIVANTMVAVIYNADEDRFELLGSVSSSSGGGGGGPVSFYGCQPALSSDVQIFANSETDISWDYDDISAGISSNGPWIDVFETGYYEVSLVLAMDFPAADSILVEMQKYHASSSWTEVRNELNVAEGLATYSFDPVLIFLEDGDAVKWMVTSGSGDATIKSGDLRTRCSVKLLSAAAPVAAAPLCLASKGGGEGLSTNSETPINFDGSKVDPGSLHDGNEWFTAPSDGFYEAGLVLSMEMTADELLEIRLVKDDGSSESMVSLNEMDAPSGLNMFTLTPVLLELNQDDRIKWTVTATLDTPSIRGSDYRTRGSFKFLGPSS